MVKLIEIQSQLAPVGKICESEYFETAKFMVISNQTHTYIDKFYEYWFFFTSHLKEHLIEEMGMNEEVAMKYLNVSTTEIARWGWDSGLPNRKDSVYLR